MEWPQLLWCPGDGLFSGRPSDGSQDCGGGFLPSLVSSCQLNSTLTDTQFNSTESTLTEIGFKSQCVCVTQRTKNRVYRKGCEWGEKEFMTLGEAKNTEHEQNNDELMRVNERETPVEWMTDTNGVDQRMNE